MGDRVVVGIFVGGRSRRMGGRPKGLLRAPGSEQSLVESLARAARDADSDPVLVGDASPYDGLLPDLVRLADDPPGVGPLGGLSALLSHAGPRTAVTVACDMPHVDAAILRRLAGHPAGAAVVAPRRDGRWEPMLARWRADRVRPALAAALEGGVRSFQRLLGELDVTELELDEAVERALVDWDTPEDVERPR